MELKESLQKAIQDILNMSTEELMRELEKHNDGDITTITKTLSNIDNVEGHSDILAHIYNKNIDSAREWTGFVIERNKLCFWEQIVLIKKIKEKAKKLLVEK